MSLKIATICLLLHVVNQTFTASDKVICYYASWAASRFEHGVLEPEDIDPHLCTHINYAFAGLNDDGTLQIDDPYFQLARMGALKALNNNLKLFFTVGGAAMDPSIFVKVSNDTEKIEALARSTIEMCEYNHFDGLDIDWEYPYDGNAEQFINFLTVLKAAFEPEGYLLSVAVNSIPSEAGGYDIPAISDIVDVINVMTYDFATYEGGVTAEHSPLYGGVNESQWQKDNRNADAAIRQWLDGGADPQKITLGIPFYGRHFILSDPSDHGLGAKIRGPGEPGLYTNSTGTLGYNEICEFHGSGNVVFLDDMKVPYMYTKDFWIGYDNEESVAAKVQYAKENNLAGVHIWSVDTDDLNGRCGEENGLLKSINDAMNT